VTDAFEQEETEETEFRLVLCSLRFLLFKVSGHTRIRQFSILFRMFELQIAMTKKVAFRRHLWALEFLSLGALNLGFV
jgi:hypothetical protein